MVTGVSANTHAKYKTWSEAVAVWRTSCHPGAHGHPIEPSKLDSSKPHRLSSSCSPRGSSQYRTPPQTPSKPSKVSSPPATAKTPLPSSTPSRNVRPSTPSHTPDASGYVFGVRVASPGGTVVKVYDDRSVSRHTTRGVSYR